MPQRIAIVGTGPTGIYTLKALADLGLARAVTLFEGGPQAGRGMPYAPGQNTPEMLANIGSIEIPPLGQSYLDWLEGAGAGRLADYGLGPEVVDERAFLPRLLLGDWFADELAGLVQATGARVLTGAEVVDVKPGAGEVRLVWRQDGALHEAEFDRVVLATGHVWPEQDQAAVGRFTSPWPAMALGDVGAETVGILGSSLSAIDAALALACAQGRFERVKGELDYIGDPGSEGLRMVMLSRNGLLPEADFWCPLPYEPLVVCTDEALAKARGLGSKGLLDRVFALMKAEITLADPGFAARRYLGKARVEDFPALVFGRRKKMDAFDWAEANLAETLANHKAQKVVGWRYAILRLHEEVGALLPAMTAADRTRFERFLKPVFTDNYAAVPPLSIERLLALHRAGRLRVLAMGENYRLRPASSGVTLACKAGRFRFSVFVDARGQGKRGQGQWPFPTMRAMLGRGAGPMDLDGAFRPKGMGRVHVLALPWLLERNPFVQGIGASRDLAARVAAAVAVENAMIPAEGPGSLGLWAKQRAGSRWA
ncbi:FAD/NAD(P)-binding protein [Neogemmobacter tilapiae]|uniref:FAD/NAD(P) binding domain-containing protein n=1 Tax=Neogemmobacter tilapiae TaxID=875041 RepID=A0A918WLN9_9RHOB|nr:FAD/NAD(P)-binding protein [Gemmobacter tilapiae]GHC54579.1 FAD/NAD(P) binding domain-containing protein [Gemmobacter tilapiae]